MTRRKLEKASNCLIDAHKIHTSKTKNTNTEEKTFQRQYFEEKIQDMTISTMQKAQESYQATSHKLADHANEDKSWVPNPGFHETRKALGKSFAGTDTVAGEPFCDWAVNHIDGDWFFEGGEQENYNNKHKTEALMFGVGFPIYVAKKNQRSLFIAKRDNNTKDIVSTAVVVEYDSKKHGTMGAKLVEGWRLFKSFCVMMHQCQIPELFANKKYKAERDHFERKLVHAMSLSEKWHKEEGPKEVHWYVQSVGVSPDYNGQGLGRDLMEKVSGLADGAGVSCYLECGVSKRGFYEKMGYRVVANKQVDDPVDSKRDPLELLLMIRQPRGQEELLCPAEEQGQ